MSREDYAYYLSPSMNRIINSVREMDTPVIVFGIGASHLIPEWKKRLTSFVHEYSKGK